MGSGDGYFHEYPVFPKKNRKLIPPIIEFYVKVDHLHNEWLISVPTGRFPGASDEPHGPIGCFLRESEVLTLRQQRVLTVRKRSKT